jgi:hypothetical protein
LLKSDNEVHIGSFVIQMGGKRLCLIIEGVMFLQPSLVKLPVT